MRGGQHPIITCNVFLCKVVCLVPDQAGPLHLITKLKAKRKARWKAEKQGKAFLEQKFRLEVVSIIRN